MAGEGQVVSRGVKTGLTEARFIARADKTKHQLYSQGELCALNSNEVKESNDSQKRLS